MSKQCDVCNLKLKFDPCGLCPTNDDYCIHCHGTGGTWYCPRCDVNVSITITGASDDLIEIEGHIVEEWVFPYTEEKRYIAVSDGTLLTVQYDSDGLWRFNRLIAGSATYEKTPGDVPSDTHDVVKLTGKGKNLTWVMLGDALALSEDTDHE